MTRREEKLLLDLINTPRRGSKIAAAKRYGVDLTLTVRRLRLTPTQRALEMEGALRLLEELQRARRNQSKRAAARPKDLNALPELEALKELKDAQKKEKKQ